jgi:sterol desaturase/sphingolipid hydroxylase (fatty acid hydroxylase superfamily)
VPYPWWKLLQAVAFPSAVVILLAVEHRTPLRRWSRGLRTRLGPNVVLTVLTLGVGALVVAPVALLTARWAGEQGLGLLNVLPLPFAGKLIAGFLLLDATFYYWHRANHLIRPLWWFHRVHHVDPDLDVTTSFRFHPGEILYSTGFRVLQVALLGVSPLIYGVYQVVFTCATAFHHSNVRLPLGLERAVNKVFVTPRMHGIHHSVVVDESNDNCSVVFSWWDRLNRTLRLNVPQEKVTIGVAGLDGESDNRALPLLALPFAGRRGQAPPRRDAEELAGEDRRELAA